MHNEDLRPGQKVQFKLGDVHLPSIQEILDRMSEETELHGSITLLSNHGDKKNAFVVVEVQGILMPIIVPAARVKNFAGLETMAAEESW